MVPVVQNYSLVNEAAAEAFYDRVSPVNCQYLKIFSITCSLLFFLSFTCNLYLLYLFGNYRELRSRRNIFLITITFFNFFGCILEFPFVIVSTYSCRWMFGKRGCIFSGFVMYFVGCVSIFLFTSISLERYFIFRDPFFKKYLTVRTNVKCIVFCSLFGLLWSVLPLFGWSYYTLESNLVTCGVEWSDRSLGVVSYNIAIFVFVFFIPLLIIVYTSCQLIRRVNASKHTLLKQNLAYILQKRIKLERRVTIIFLVLIISFFMTWSPYAFVSMYTAFINAERLHPMLTLVPSLFAKSSFLWTALFHILSNKDLHKKINLFRKTRRPEHSLSFSITYSAIRKTPGQ